MVLYKLFSWQMSTHTLPLQCVVAVVGQLSVSNLPYVHVNILWPRRCLSFGVHVCVRACVLTLTIDAEGNLPITHFAARGSAGTQFKLSARVRLFGRHFSSTKAPAVFPGTNKQLCCLGVYCVRYLFILDLVGLLRHVLNLVDKDLTSVEPGSFSTVQGT